MPQNANLTVSNVIYGMVETTADKVNVGIAVVVGSLPLWHEWVHDVADALVLFAPIGALILGLLQGYGSWLRIKALQRKLSGIDDDEGVD